MKVEIFDVSHGFCAYLVADNGNVMLFDCGHNERTGFRPSEYLPRNGCRGIEHLVIQNFDEDHVSDLQDLLRVLRVKILSRNRSISSNDLRSLKEDSGPLSLSMQAAIDLHESYILTVSDPPEFPGIEIAHFHNDYPAFDDTNNLSLVSFVHYDGMGIVFTGDLEIPGWRALLRNPSFCSQLRRVNVFIASHHGRESGYCREVFDYCKPEIVIISDKEIVHETQRQTYAQHASGIPWNSGPDKRYVLTTRTDGMITISKKPGEGYQINIAGEGW